MNNQTFCYWLQGYFEISTEVTLNKQKLHLIEQQLNLITEPLGDFTQWLKNLLLYLKEQKYQKKLLHYFQKEINDQLNLVFYHVIDNSYNTEMSLLELQKIHDGITND